ncbi:hypothetical protein K432DRAFT_430383 [Lepidopterella palustris CBS 459.81]|uniref:Uncharacterized protein n=1 Tax=Lepidopterella palustris CBS 459.81 TaxID=1314670 RepID=A0A8E2DY78_9PEZI|nr:hypothetical protein K432DRAFT_430383 [Lepidopterella palustris CBS 459.81]
MQIANPDNECRPSVAPFQSDTSDNSITPSPRNGVLRKRPQERIDNYSRMSTSSSRASIHKTDLAESPVEPQPRKRRRRIVEDSSDNEPVSRLPLRKLLVCLRVLPSKLRWILSQPPLANHVGGMHLNDHQKESSNESQELAKSVDLKFPLNTKTLERLLPPVTRTDDSSSRPSPFPTTEMQLDHKAVPGRHWGDETITLSLETMASLPPINLRELLIVTTRENQVLKEEILHWRQQCSASRQLQVVTKSKSALQYENLQLKEQISRLQRQCVTVQPVQIVKPTTSSAKSENQTLDEERAHSQHQNFTAQPVQAVKEKKHAPCSDISPADNDYQKAKTNPRIPANGAPNDPKPAPPKATPVSSPTSGRQSESLLTNNDNKKETKTGTQLSSASTTNAARLAETEDAPAMSPTTKRQSDKPLSEKDSSQQTKMSAWISSIDMNSAAIPNATKDSQVLSPQKRSEMLLLEKDMEKRVKASVHINSNSRANTVELVASIAKPTTSRAIQTAPLIPPVVPSKPPVVPARPPHLPLKPLVQSFADFSSPTAPKQLRLESLERELAKALEQNKMLKRDRVSLIGDIDHIRTEKVTAEERAADAARRATEAENSALEARKLAVASETIIEDLQSRLAKAQLKKDSYECRIPKRNYLKYDYKYKRLKSVELEELVSAKPEW